MKQNAVPSSCCKMPAPGCGEDLDIKDPFENIFVQGCTQMIYFNKISDHDHGGLGMAVLFLHWCSTATCVILACAFTYTSGLTFTQAMAGDEPAKHESGVGGSRSKGKSKVEGKSSKKHAKTGDKKIAGDELDFEEENRPPRGARNLLIDKSELEGDSETLDTSGP